MNKKILMILTWSRSLKKKNIKMKSTMKKEVEVEEVEAEEVEGVEAGLEAEEKVETTTEREMNLKEMMTMTSMKKLKNSPRETIRRKTCKLTKTTILICERSVN